MSNITGCPACHDARVSQRCPGIVVPCNMTDAKPSDPCKVDDYLCASMWLAESRAKR